MSTIVNRMKYLRKSEAMFAVALPAAFLLYWTKHGTPVAWDVRLPALFLVSYLLLQGATYWHLKIAALEQRVPLPPYFGRLFGALKWTNLLFMVAMLVPLIAAAVQGEVSVDVKWASGLLAFAILEQINYYHYQLMYDTRGAIASLRRNARLRKAALAVDLARA